MQFTEEQQQVIDSRGENLLVSAAAGSGKTAVLVERILQRILEETEPVDIDRMLIVTFTNAAAAEMRERISLAISKALEEHPDSVHLQRQSTLVHSAQIMTIDSFCLFIIRNNFNDIGLDPAFRVADEGEVRLLEEDTMAQLLEEEFAEGREPFLNCVETYSTNGREQALEECISGLYHYALSDPFPEAWLERCKKDYEIHTVEELEQSSFARLAKEFGALTVAGCREQIQAALALCNRPDGPYMYGEALEQDLELLERLEKCDSVGTWHSTLGGMAFKTLSSKKDSSVNPGLREQAKELRNQCKASLQDLRDKYFAKEPKQVVEQCELCSPAVRELLDLSLKFKAAMDAKKRERGILDFSDMEHLALEILVERKETEGGTVEILPSKTAEDYRDFYEEIMIDEYQDSNLVQEYLLGSIAKENNRFMVGDVKQSIYKFRQARPELFLEKMKVYGAAEETSQNRMISLHKNFRSRAEVLDAVNFCFDKIMAPEVGGIDYTEAEALYLGAGYPEGTEAETYATEVLLVPKASEEEQEDLDSREKEAAVIAGKIREMVGHFPVTDKETGQLRPARYRDMVILLRSGTGYEDALRTILEQEGIPAYITSKTGYFMTTEIRTILQVLRVWDNPLQDIPLYGVLTSVFAGFSEEEIAQIRGITTPPKGRHKVALYESLKRYVELGEETGAEAEKENGDRESVDTGAVSGEQTGAAWNPELAEKVSDFLQWLALWRERTTYMPIHELLQTLFRESHYLQYVTALPAGEKRRANVELLMEKANAFEKTSFYGLFHFIRYLEKIEKYQVDYGEAEILDENADLVRIMTIHKSKGLEFPICFVAGLSKRFNLRDTTKMLLTDPDMGVGTDAVDLERRTFQKTMRKSVMAAKMQIDSLGEELRVLYVAMTRAKEKLILTGIVEGQDKWKKQLAKAVQGAETEGKLNFQTLTKASCFLDYLLPVLCTHPAFAGILQEAELELPGGAVTEDGAFPKLTVKVMDMPELAAQEVNRELTRLEERTALQDVVRGKTELSGQEQQLLEELRTRFDWNYPHANLANLYTKTTVSELKKAAMSVLAEKEDESFHAFKEEEIVPYVPGFMRQEEKVSGTTRGSAFHKVLELLPLTDFLELMEQGDLQKLQAAVVQTMDALATDGKLTREFREAVNPGKIAHFLQSRLALRMAQAQKRGQLYREQPFVLGVPADRLGAEFPHEEMVLVQGIIDVCFEEDGKMILADYKTDVVERPVELVERYRTQLAYYTEALERLMEKEVAEQIIYSFHFEREILL